MEVAARLDWEIVEAEVWAVSCVRRLLADSRTWLKAERGKFRGPIREECGEYGKSRKLEGHVFLLTLSILPPMAPINPSKCLPNTAKLPASSNNLPPPPPTLLLAALAARLVLALPLTWPLPLVETLLAAVCEVDVELASAICWCWRRMASSEAERPSWESGMEGGRGPDRDGGIDLVGGSCGVVVVVVGKAHITWYGEIVVAGGRLIDGGVYSLVNLWWWEGVRIVSLFDFLCGLV